MSLALWFRLVAVINVDAPGVNAIGKELAEWRFASWCYRFGVGGGRARVGKGGAGGGADLGATRYHKQIHLPLSNMLTYAALSASRQMPQKTVRRWPRIFLSPQKVFFNMQTHCLCQAIHTNQFTAPFSTQNPGPIQEAEGSLRQLMMELLLIATEFRSTGPQASVFRGRESWKTSFQIVWIKRNLFKDKSF